MRGFIVAGLSRKRAKCKFTAYLAPNQAAMVCTMCAEILKCFLEAPLELTLHAIRVQAGEYFPAQCARDV